MAIKPIVYLVAMLAHLPILIPYFSKLWGRGHYQFFPILLLVVGWLAYDRLWRKDLDPEKQPSTPIRPKFNWPLALILGDLALLILASLMYAPFYVMPSIMALSAAYLIDRFGTNGFLRALPVWLLLILIIAPPSNFDKRLIHQMQFVASAMASWTLDTFGLIHFREGVVLVTESRQFFTEEACSGVRSLFSSFAAIAIFGVTRNYSLIRHALNLFQTLGWVLIGNAIRIAVVVYVSDNWTEAIATGTTHEMLGYGFFLLIFGCAVCTDRASNLLGSHPIGAAQRMHPNVAKSQTNDLPTNAQTNSMVTGHLAAPHVIKPAVLNGLLILFVLTGVFGTRLVYAKNLKHIFRPTDYVLSPLTAEALPAKIGEWEQVNFEYVVRDPENPFGLESYTSVFQNAEQKIVVSVDGPYPEFHNLARCYPGRGWKASTKHQYVGLNSSVPGKNQTVLDLTKPDQHAVVFYTAVDRFNNVVIPKEGNFYVSRSKVIAANNFRIALGLKDPKMDFGDNKYQLPIRQIQVFHQDESTIPPDQVEEIEKLFATARDLLLESPQ